MSDAFDSPKVPACRVSREVSITAEQVAADLDAHLARYERHRQEYLERQAHQDTMQEANLKAIEALTKSTSGLVEAWTVANGFQRFIVWTSKFAVVGTAALWSLLAMFILKH